MENTAQRAMDVPVQDVAVLRLALALLVPLNDVDALLAEIVGW